MSGKSTAWVREQRVAREDQDVSAVIKKGIMLLLADHSGADHFSYPSIRTLAGDLECSERTVTRALKELTSDGYLVKEGRWTDSGKQTSNGYVLKVGQPVEGDTQSPSPPGRGDTQSPSPPPDCHPPPDKPVTPHVESPLEPPLEKERAGAREPDGGSPDPARGESAERSDQAAPADGSPGGDEPEPPKPKIGDRWRERILPALREKIGQIECKNWIETGIKASDGKHREGFAVIAHTDDLLILRAPTPFAANWVRSNYIGDLARAAHCRVEIVEGPWQELLVRYAAQIDESWKIVNANQETET